MLVKVCGLKDKKNINDVSNLDIDFMGLIFYRKSERFFDKDYLVKKNNKKIVGVFVNETIDEIKRISKKYDLDMSQMSIKFCEEQEFMTSVIIGATTMEQLKTNIESVKVNLDSEVIKEINNVQKKYPNPCP